MVMCSLSVAKIESVDFNTIHRILRSNSITEAQKEQFIRKHQAEIHKIMEGKISGAEFRGLMKNRPLQKFRPLKNSFTKMGDKKLLGIALDIEPADVPSYIEEVTEQYKELGNLDFLPKDKIDALKSYVYRHGTKAQLINFLDYELTCTKDKIKTLYRTLEYHTGGAADYFIRPIHRMDRKTFIKVYAIVNKNIDDAKKAGDINEEDREKIAKWALIQLYKIRHNSEFINAVKTYKELKS